MIWRSGALRNPAAAMEQLAECFKVFSEPNRLAVLEALRGGALNVPAVVECTGLSQALVSKHLKLLTIAGVAQRRPEGSLAYNEVLDQGVFKLMAQAEKLIRLQSAGKLLQGGTRRPRPPMRRPGAGQLLSAGLAGGLIFPICGRSSFPGMKPTSPPHACRGPGSLGR